MGLHLLFSLKNQSNLLTSLLSLITLLAQHLTFFIFFNWLISFIFQHEKFFFINLKFKIHITNLEKESQPPAYQLNLHVIPPGLVHKIDQVQIDGDTSTPSQNATFILANIPTGFEPVSCKDVFKAHTALLYIVDYSKSSRQRVD